MFRDREQSPTVTARAIRAGVVCGLVLAAAAMMLAPLVLPETYSWISHTTSEAAAQGVDGAWLTRTGFLLFAFAVLTLAVVASGYWTFVARCLHGAFAVSMVAVATYAHKPWEPGIPFDSTEDLLHSIGATLVGFAFAFGVVAVLLGRARGQHWLKLLDVVAIAASILIPLGMLAWESHTGLLQRTMFGVAMIWYAIAAIEVGRAGELSVSRNRAAHLH